MCDFENCEWLGGERIPYKLIRCLFLEQLYKYSRTPENFNCQWGGGWDKYEQQHKFAYEAIEPTLNQPIEKLMLEVLVLLLAAGRQSKSYDEYHRKKIITIREEFSIEEFFKILCDDELIELRADVLIADIPLPPVPTRTS